MPHNSPSPHHPRPGPDLWLGPLQLEALEALRGNKVRSQGSKGAVEEVGAKAVVTCISVRSHALAAHGDMALQRAVPGEGALEEGTAGALREALLVDDAQEDRRRSPWGAGPLLGQLRSLPSAEACADAEAAREQTGSEEQGVVAGVGAQVERGAV